MDGDKCLICGSVEDFEDGEDKITVEYCNGRLLCHGCIHRIDRILLGDRQQLVGVILELFEKE